MDGVGNDPTKIVSDCEIALEYFDGIALHCIALHCVDCVDLTFIQVMVLGATNLPWELDEALRRRLEKRICKSNFLNFVVPFIAPMVLHSLSIFYRRHPVA